MRVTVIGCSGTLPGPSSPCSSYLVQHDGFRLLVDFGNGAAGALQRHIGLLTIDAVLITHVHADHCLDLVPLSYARRYHPDGPRTPLPVYGPSGLPHRISAALDRPQSLDDVYNFRSLSVGHGPDIGPFRLTTALTNHPVETHAVRLSVGDVALAYSADTGPSEAVTDLARGADLFLCEATFAGPGSHPPDLHLTASQAGEMAHRAGVGRLALTHLVPWLDPESSQAEAASAFGGPVTLAHGGDTHAVPVRSGHA